jgi:uncharacterized membrane protein (Fun14 family)
MSSEPFLSSIIPFAGSGLLGYTMGFALKKVLKWMLIIVGFLAGMFFVGVQLLQRYGYVSAVNWDKLGNDTSTQIQHWSANVDVTNAHSLFHTLGIPVSGGLALSLLGPALAAIVLGKEAPLEVRQFKYRSIEESHQPFDVRLHSVGGINGRQQGHEYEHLLLALASY